MLASGNPVSPQTGRGEGYVNAFQMAQLTKLAKDQQNIRTGSPTPSIGSVRNSAESPYLSTAAIQNLNIRFNFYYFFIYEISQYLIFLWKFLQMKYITEIWKFQRIF